MSRPEGYAATAAPKPLPKVNSGPAPGACESWCCGASFKMRECQRHEWRGFFINLTRYESCAKCGRGRDV